MNYPSTSLSSVHEMGPPNLPCGDLLGSRDDYNNICIPLYFASLKGDWEAAEAIIDKRQELVRFSITENCDTALHVAASSKSSKQMEIFVENLLDIMSMEDLELQNKKYNTALCLAATNGNIRIVKAMVEKNNNLLGIPGSQEMLPLQLASLSGQRDVVRYLFDSSKKMTGEIWTDQKRCWVLQQCVQADLFDVALQIVIDRPELTTNGTVLGILARKKDAFNREKTGLAWEIGRRLFRVESGKVSTDAKRLLRIIWTDIVKLPKSKIEDIMIGPPDMITYVSPKHSSQVLFVATEMGNTEFVIELICQYPDLIWKTNDNNQTIFHVAVSHRHVGIYNLLHELGSMKDMITHLKDENGNNMLHLAGQSAKNISRQSVTVPAVQMRNELLWFKEVESMIPFSCREEKNKDGLLPRELFTKEHKDLMSRSEKWMKGTAKQSMVVAALIATIAFAAAFTIPGGYNQNTGIPILLHKKYFIYFVIYDAISMFFSSISIIFFLKLLASPYAEHDFLISLPQTMFRGQSMLCYSIIFMLLAFSTNFNIFYQNSLGWVPYLISVFGFVTLVVSYFHFLGFEFFDTDSEPLFKPKKPKLYYRNPKF